jgi:hypothetical protein
MTAPTLLLDDGNSIPQFGGNPEVGQSRPDRPEYRHLRLHASQRRGRSPIGLDTGAEPGVDSDTAGH